MSRALLFLAIAALIACAVQCRMIRSLHEEKNRLKANQTALLDTVRTYRTKAGKLAASCQILQLNKVELEKSCAGLMGAVKDLRIKLSRAKALSQSVTDTRVDIVAHVRDSTIRKDSLPTKVKAVNWSDPWTDVSGYLRGSEIKLRVNTRDTLTQVVHRVPRRFLFFRWGTKAIRQEIRSSNPHTRLVYTRYIELK